MFSFNYLLMMRAEDRRENENEKMRTEVGEEKRRIGEWKEEE